jgi:uncharacterized protein with NRDE domain
MCTVTFIPAGNGGYITSNRDEQTERGSTTIAPQWHMYNNVAVLHPKDKQTGGTWIVINEKGCVAVLLNGAYEKHSRKASYRKSRGLVLLDIICSENAIETLHHINLEDIEPFTCLLYLGNALFEMRWDAFKKEIKPLDITKSYIWSSCTLYNSTLQVQRNNMLGSWLHNNAAVTSKNIIAFHELNDYQTSMKAAKETYIEQIQTVSITQVCILENDIQMKYYDKVTAHTPTYTVEQAEGLSVT